eukprot:TRINITY_DN73856_c0_g1_i1.p1 TRINITY_DN73856_c0_g1~~TRINITY_DN73856_c0_g1_i1.p1  ORF type:complete len:382 (-),score=77.19 TRINITY_DN73856_c0_g1_i1:146-1291(-)
MSLVLASICLALVGFLCMVVAAVVAFVAWNGALWWMEHKNNGGLAGHGDNPKGLQGVESWQSSSGSSPAYHDFSDLYRAHSGSPSSGRCGTVPPSIVRPSVVVEVNSPTPPRRDRASRKSHEAPPSPVLECSQIASCNPTPEELLRGYAAQLALKFGGDLQFHLTNIEASVEAYELNPDDMCYCFLCLEEAGKGEPGLSLKRWGTGQYAARLWVTALARFVKAAQGLRSALDSSRTEPLCEEWQYNHEHFLREVKACELPFQRNHGRALLMAFMQDEIRRGEVLRARKILKEHGVAAEATAKPKTLGRLCNAQAPGLCNFPAWGWGAPGELPPLALPSSSAPAALEDAEDAKKVVERKRTRTAEPVGNSTAAASSRKRGRK